MSSTDLRTAPRQGRSQETIQIVLDAAERVFDERGIDNATTSDIAVEAGVSVGRIYYWFASKQAILEGLVERAERLLTEKFAESFASNDERRGGELSFVLLKATVEVCREHRSIAPILLGHAQAVGGDRPEQRLRQSILGSSVQLIHKRAPDAPEHEARLVAHVLLSIALGSLPEMIAADDDTLLEEVVFAMVAYYHGRYPPEADCPGSRPSA